jgi:hypothetical protein
VSQKGKHMSESPIKWELKSIPLKDLKSHAKNPRQIKKDAFDRLNDLIEKFGLIDKPILNLDLTIIGGHQRVKIMRKQRAKTVECWIPDRLLSEEEVEELMIGVNKFQGEWDIDRLANEWEPLDLLKYGFTEEELLGTCKEAEEVLEKEVKSSEKKKKECPNCGFGL